ncbi:PREDICTED: F-box protein At2g17690-like [Fragaria vesca subsp. vesca]|uniref:F-box protein At2g17690-like n=1 Tax=Fragaria vesca subsp. vesca TaxID=101020 RepID=UPI0002C2F8B1|nr:PREDICTED: F-box protein At2g17690-like [Fragaria vesca subsp. vesca]
MSNKKLCHIDCPDWASLHGALVYLLLDKLLEPIDHVRFAAVCKEWGAVSEDYNEAKHRWCKKRLLPMLLISSAESEEKLELYSIAERKVYSNIELALPYRKSMRCFGSNHDSGGWLIVVDIVEAESPYLDITLVNPFRKEVPPIHLPRLVPGSPFNYLSEQGLKVILSGDPTLNPDSFVVLAIIPYTDNVSYIKGLNSVWVFWGYGFGSTDAIVNKSKIYSVSRGHGFGRRILFLDVDQAKTNMFYLPEPLFRSPGKLYLVESAQGDLLLVQRVMEPKKNVNGLHHNKELWTSSFVIHKATFIKRDEKVDGPCSPLRLRGCSLILGDGDRSAAVQLNQVESIGDEVLFVGNNYSFSVLASDYPGTCQPNSIYYTDDSMEIELDGDAPYDMGIFNLADKSITPLCSSLNHSKRIIQPPFWTIPPFSGLW